MADSRFAKEIFLLTAVRTEQVTMIAQFFRRDSDSLSLHRRVFSAERSINNGGLSTYLLHAIESLA